MADSACVADCSEGSCCASNNTAADEILPSPLQIELLKQFAEAKNQRNKESMINLATAACMLDAMESSMDFSDSFPVETKCILMADRMFNILNMGKAVVQSHLMQQMGDENNPEEIRVKTQQIFDRLNSNYKRYVDSLRSVITELSKRPKVEV